MSGKKWSPCSAPGKLKELLIQLHWGRNILLVHTLPVPAMAEDVFKDLCHHKWSYTRICISRSLSSVEVTLLVWEDSTRGISHILLWFSEATAVKQKPRGCLKHWGCAEEEKVFLHFYLSVGSKAAWHSSLPSFWDIPLVVPVLSLTRLTQSYPNNKVKNTLGFQSCTWTLPTIKSCFHVTYLLLLSEITLTWKVLHLKGNFSIVQATVHWYW